MDRHCDDCAKGAQAHGHAQGSEGQIGGVDAYWAKQGGI
jgi:hypothetical protein